MLHRFNIASRGAHLQRVSSCTRPLLIPEAAYTYTYPEAFLTWLHVKVLHTLGRLDVWT